MYIENLGIAKLDVARWAGIAVFLFSFCQCATAIAWGRLSDRYGRKFVIIVCLTSTAAMTLAWGFSTNLPMALVSRGLLGALNGNVGILRTVVAEMVPFKELQPTAFAVMPIFYNIGCVIGPAVSGLLADPYNVAGKPHGNRLLERFPFALPNIVAAAFFLLSLICVIFGLEETLASLKNRRDIGIWIKEKVARSTRDFISFMRNGYRRRRGEPDETDSLLSSSIDDSCSGATAADVEALQADAGANREDTKPPPWRDVFTSQSVYAILAYSMLALHSGAIDMILPVFMHHPSHEPKNFLKFDGGFGSGPRMISITYTTYSVLTLIAQLAMYPPVTNRFGILRCLKASSCIYPIVYFLMPFTALLPPTAGKIVVSTLFVIKGFGANFGYPCNTIVLTHSASSIKTLATLNGVLTVAAAISRSFAGVIGGNAFTMGVKHGYFIVPFWIIMILSLVAIIPVFLLVEDEGKD